MSYSIGDLVVPLRCAHTRCYADGGHFLVNAEVSS